MQLELWTDFCSCILFVHWMLSDSVWQPSPLITLPKAARIHVQVLCQGAPFQPRVWANLAANTYKAFSNLNEIPVVPHTHINSYIHSHTFLFSCDSLHIFHFFLRFHPKVKSRALPLKAFPLPCRSFCHASSHSFLTLYMRFLQTLLFFSQLFSQTHTKWG